MPSGEPPLRPGSLAGRRILVTRPRRPGQTEEPLATALESLGAEVLWLPALEIGPPDDWSELDRALARLASFDWVVFTSQNGVEGFAQRLRASGVLWLDRPRPAAIGPKTAEALARLGRREVHVSREPIASALAQSLEGDCAGRRFLWPRAQIAPDLLARSLLRCGAEEVLGAPCYAARPALADARSIREALTERRVDAVVFASARSVEATLEALGAAARQWLSLPTKICIGPVTARACEALGLGLPAVADGSLEGLVRAAVTKLDGG